MIIHDILGEISCQFILYNYLYYKKIQTTGSCVFLSFKSICSIGLIKLFFLAYSWVLPSLPFPADRGNMTGKITFFASFFYKDEGPFFAGGYTGPTPSFPSNKGGILCFFRRAGKKSPDSDKKGRQIQRSPVFNAV